MVQENNEPAAALWDEGGRDYDFISFGISDALAHTVAALWPEPGERVLDIATGTGWSARNVARFGADVVAVDIADELLAAAEALSRHVVPPIEYLHADAENLPFEEASFDAVISTFGIMFAADHAAAAGELARVCRPGGGIALATWSAEPDSLVARMFALVAQHAGTPPPASSPMNWGRADYVESLLGQDFELEFSEGVSTAFVPDGAQLWEIFRRGFGPVRRLAGRLGPDELAAFKKDFIALHDETWQGKPLRVERKYVLITGMRL